MSCEDLRKMKREEEISGTHKMNIKMGSSLVSDKLDRINFTSWKYKMTQFVVVQGHFSHVDDN